MSKADNEKLKLIQDKCQIILGNLLREEDNKYCVDCDAKGPRWASWNLGIFLCIRCAGIHRNLGVHISKVKSVNLDTWTAEQVACLQQMGNSQARAVYEANLPESFRRPQTDSSLEAFIRAKYEQKKYIAKEWVPPPAPKPAFDIEDEKRKEREKKKKNKASTAIEVGGLSQLPNCALPRPHTSGSVSPSVKPVQQETSKPSEPQVPGSVDLLNLGDPTAASGDDIFDVFLSAPMSTVPDNSVTSTASSVVNNSVSSITADEADFFNQKSDGSTNQSNKMTKESILSLYASNTCQVPPPPQQIAPMYGIPGGMYVPQQAYAQVAMAGYPAMPNTGINPVQQQMANLQISGQAWNVAGNLPVNVPVNIPVNVSVNVPVNSAPANTGNLVIGSNQPTGVIWPPVTGQNQNFAKNIWQ